MSVLWCIYLAALYGFIGAMLAAILTPGSWPFGRAALIALLWPWAMAGCLWWLVTGRWPRWMLPLD